MQCESQNGVEAIISPACELLAREKVVRVVRLESGSNSNCSEVRYLCWDKVKLLRIFCSIFNIAKPAAIPLALKVRIPYLWPFAPLRVNVSMKYLQGRCLELPSASSDLRCVV